MFEDINVECGRRQCIQRIWLPFLIIRSFILFTILIPPLYNGDFSVVDSEISQTSEPIQVQFKLVVGGLKIRLQR